MNELITVSLILLTVLAIQLLLCFKVKILFFRLLPSFVLTASTIIFFTMMRLATDWDAIGYAILFVFSGVLLIFSGIAWVIWAIVKLIKKRKGNQANSNL